MAGKRKAEGPQPSRSSFIWQGREVPLTKKGKPDMRFNISKEYVQSQQVGNNGQAHVPLAATLRPREGRAAPERTQSMAIPVHRLQAVLEAAPLGNRRILRATRSRAPLQVNNVVQNHANAGIVDHNAETAVLVIPGPARAAVENVNRNINEPGAEEAESNIPEEIPVTKANIPDMRSRMAREWVEEQAKKAANVIEERAPGWLPKTKDGCLDYSKKIVQTYVEAQQRAGKLRANLPMHDNNRRMRYYLNKLRNPDKQFLMTVANVRDGPVPAVQFITLNNEDILSSAANRENDLFASSGEMESREGLKTSDDSGNSDLFEMPSYIPEVDGETLELTIYNKSKNKIGQGAFGIVYKGSYNGEDAAIKQLHLDKLTTCEITSFEKEIMILATFGNHPNLVKLFGYTQKPHYSIIMEYVELGSLQHLLYFVKNDELEAKITDGRYKKRIVDGIANGMRQLHSVEIIHHDLKPGNVLITKDFTAKVTDFGLSRLRGKTTTLLRSHRLDEADNVIAGTAAYMAPELIDCDTRADYKVDVWAFAITLNEILHEEEPFSQEFDMMRGRGPFAAAEYAKRGNRPYLNESKVPKNVVALIKKCWGSIPHLRPTFDEIVECLQDPAMKFPHFVDITPFLRR